MPAVHKTSPPETDQLLSRQRGRTSSRTAQEAFQNGYRPDNLSIAADSNLQVSKTAPAQPAGKLQKAFDKLQKITKSMATSSPPNVKRERRSQSVPRDYNRTEQTHSDNRTLVKSTTNSALDQSFTRSRAWNREDEVSRENISGMFSTRSKHHPGVVGIRNHGNTCFMNAVLQCLSNTQFFAEYFLTDEYRTNSLKYKHCQGNSSDGASTDSLLTNGDLFTSGSPLANGGGVTNGGGGTPPDSGFSQSSLITNGRGINRCVTPTKERLVNGGVGRKAEHQVNPRVGALTESLARLLKSLWACKYSPDISTRFKDIVGDYGSQYEGTDQNDAQEFLLWLLDKLHDDRGANASLLGTSRPVDQLNDSSIVYDLFQARYRSTLTCPNCEKQSKTYDPFLSVSLPIQQKLRIPVEVTIVRWSKPLDLLKVGLLMNSADIVKDLRRMIAERNDIQEKQMLLISIQHQTFQRTFEDNDAIADINENDIIYAIEIQPTPYEVGPDSRPLTSKYITIVALNNTYTNTHRKRVGCPFTVQVSRDVIAGELQMALLKGMNGMIKENCFTQALSSFYITIPDGTPDGTHLSTDDDLPLYSLIVDDALGNCVDGAGPAHIKFILQWPYKLYKSYMINTTVNSITVDHSVKAVKAESQQTTITNLEDCFKIFTQQERLGSEDTWYCTNCRRSQLGTIKTLSLCSLPDILIIHLKRFRQEGDNRTKLNTLIEFPVSDLDMSSHVEPESDDLQPISKQRETRGRSPDYLYDLYAVCNHIGNMQGGHYTAYCKSPISGRWYSYDDHKISEIRSSESLITKNAYLLFYRRRTAVSRCQVSLPKWIAREFNLAATPSTASHNTTLQDTDLDDSPSDQSQIITNDDRSRRSQANINVANGQIPVQNLQKTNSTRTLGMGTPQSRYATDCLSSSASNTQRVHDSSRQPPPSNGGTRPRTNNNVNLNESVSSSRPGHRVTESMRRGQFQRAALQNGGYNHEPYRSVRPQPPGHSAPLPYVNRTYFQQASASSQRQPYYNNDASFRKNSYRSDRQKDGTIRRNDSSSSSVPEAIRPRRVPTNARPPPAAIEPPQPSQSPPEAIRPRRVPTNARPPPAAIEPPQSSQSPPEANRPRRVSTNARPPPAAIETSQPPPAIPESVLKLVPRSRRGIDMEAPDVSSVVMPLPISVESIEIRAAKKKAAKEAKVVSEYEFGSSGRVRISRDLGSPSCLNTTFQYVTTNGRILQESTV